MSAPMVSTRHPGVYKRGSRYVVRYRVNGRHKSESARTIDEALRLQRARQTDIDRGEFHEQARVTFQPTPASGSTATRAAGGVASVSRLATSTAGYWSTTRSRSSPSAYGSRRSRRASSRSSSAGCATSRRRAARCRTPRSATR